jgi:hypothetical protein
MKTIAVSGALANKCFNGGEAWVRLNWILGLRRLGLHVFFVEQISRESCVDAAGVVAPFEESVNLAYFKKVTEQFSLSGCAALIYENGEQIHGLSQGQLLEWADSADLLVNISGHLSWDPLWRRLRRKAYVDIDPGFTQFWHAAGIPGPRLAGHDFYFTIAENIGTSPCSIPAGKIPWRPIRQPVVLELWPVCRDGMRTRFTTVASWRGPYGPVAYAGKTFGLKVHEFRKFVELPRRVQGTFEIALDIHPNDARDLNLLRSNGWQIVDPRLTVPDPLAFRSYVQESGAEFSVAQGIYVETKSGWFSDRTVRYLASGKPALVQDTGFSRHYPVGDGLLAFRTLEEAVHGAEEIARNYDRHCQAARLLAEDYFDSDKVLGRLLEEVDPA